MKELAPGTFKADDEDLCPCCGTNLNAYANMGDDNNQPSSGDICICYECAAYLVVDDNMKLREMTVDELVELPNDLLVTITGLRARIQKANQTMGDNYEER